MNGQDSGGEHDTPSPGGAELWRPSTERMAASRMARFARTIEQRHDVDFGDYDYEALWRWSVENVEEFWGEVWRFFDIAPGTRYATVLADRGMPGASWFPGAHLNFAEHVLRAGATRLDDVVLIATGEDDTVREVTWRELQREVAAVANALRRFGVEPGERVVAYLPNIPEAIIAFLATASIGAVWSVCGPEIGVRSALDRFAQLEPAVLIAVDGYDYGGRTHDRAPVVRELIAGLPTLRAIVRVDAPGGEHRPHWGVPWAELLDTPGDLAPVQVPFDHPLWVVYSSGTTGLPKGLVHSHGGILVTGYAQNGLQGDASDIPRPVSLTFTSTTWIMWNSIVEGLLTSTGSLLLLDGSPTYPTVDRLWDLVERHGLTSVGTSPGYIAACEAAGLRPSRQHDLSTLTSVGITGAPFPARLAHWVHDEVGANVALRVFSGGTDSAVVLVGASPWSPVYAGEMSARALGMHVESWDERGLPVIDEVGELVVRTPIPSMPLRIWGDTDGSRYEDTYFSRFPGVWRQGDWITIASRGSVSIHGRSDATLNRHGVRIGSADIYQAVEAFPEVTEALVVGVEERDGGYWLPLFVTLRGGEQASEALWDAIRAAIRAQASPRHVPDEIIAVPAIPHGVTGKKLEVPVKRILMGEAPDKVSSRDAIDSPEALEWFVAFARERARNR